MKNKFESKSIKIGSIAGIYYSCGEKTDTVIVWAMGGPSVPDNGNLSGASIVLEKGIDIFVPDYIGFGRSDGEFTPMNCIKTLLNSYDLLTKGCTGICYYDMTKVKLKYKRVIFACKSLGGAYVPLLPRFNKNIKEIAIFCGALDQSEQGKVKGEETNEDFIRTIVQGGYKYLYRGFVENKKLWEDHLYDKDDLSPMDNIEYLADSKVFIAHGKKDLCIDYSKAVNFYNKLLTTFPNKKKQFKLNLYKNGGHDSKTTKPGLRAFLKWIQV